ncbi:MAG: M56 family metallopeptidase [Acidobacteriota bacterium]
MSRFTELSAWIETTLGTASFTTSLIDQVAKATILLLVALAISLLLHRASAAARHQLWTVALLAVLALPLLSFLLPAWRVPILAANTAVPSLSTTDEPTQVASAGAASVLAEASRPGVVPGIPSSSTPSHDAAGTEPRPASWPNGLLLLWAAGVLLFSGRLLVSSFAAWRIVRQATPVTDTDLLAAVDDLRRQLGIRTGVALVEHPRTTMPMAWGMVRQTVVLPTAARSWSAERRQVVLLHELAHLKRWDCQTLILARAATALHWFNPLVWIAVRRLQAEREHACDDLVLTAGTDGPDYAQHLLDIARAMRSSLSPSWAMVAMARPSELEGRLLAILDPDLDRGPTPRSARWIGGLAIALLVLPLASFQPRASAESPPPATLESVAASAESPRSARLIEAFSVALRDEDAQVRAQAAQSLGSIEDPAAVPILVKTLEDDASEGAREQAAWALGMIEDSAAVPALQAAMADGSIGVRRQAAWALGMIESALAVPELSAALGDDDAKLRAQAAWALGMIESDAAAAGLGETLTRDESAEVRQQAAWALGMIESASSVAALTSALATDASPAVREKAAWALGMVEAEDALDTLLDAMSDDSSEVRKQALWAVGQISN